MINEQKILPLGSVVTLKNGDGSQLMIIARASIIEEKRKEVYYDYGSVLIPQGMLAPEAVYFFNRENVDEVLFYGYENEEEVKFANEYDSMIKNAQVVKGTVE